MGATLTTGRFGNLNRAYSFDGEDDYIGVADSDTLDGYTEITVAAWVKTSDSFKAIVSKYQHESGSNWDDSYYLGTYNNRVRWQLNAGDSFSHVDGNANIADGQWHHIAGTWDGANQVIYVDGGHDTSHIYPGNGLINDSAEPVAIGRSIEFGNPARYLNGILDDIRIYHRALTEAEILALYYEGVYRIFLPLVIR